MKKNQIYTDRRKADKIQWSQSMDDALIDALLLQQVIGNRVNGTFITTAYDNVVTEVNDKLGKMLTKDHIKNRMKTLKVNFSSCYDIFKSGLSGFSIDSRTNMWTAEPEVWKPLIEANPMAKKWMTTPVPNYVKLVNLFGNDRATWEGSMTAKEKRNRMTLACEGTGDTIQLIDEMVSQNEAVLKLFINLGDDCEVQVEPNTSSLLKRKRRSANEDDLKDLEIMKDAFERIANAIEKSNVVPEPTQSNKYSKEDIFPAFEIIGLEEELQTEAYLHLTDDKDRMETFFACPSSKRKNVLLRMLSRAGII